ncbi:MAG: hypothetical protein KGL57_03965 [Burkholderiales bacterium]|nr:hypothetical protein [Burkholderiales bacterium]
MSPFVQDLIALGIGLLALTYLVRRWWPSAKALFKPGSEAAGCGQPGEGPSGGAACGSGCGQCGQATPRVAKDHRVHWVKHKRDASRHA